MTLTLDQLKHGTFNGTLFGSTIDPNVSLATREQQIGRPYDVVHQYSNGGWSGFNSPLGAHIPAETLSSGSKGLTTWVQDANAGKLDATFKQRASQITSPRFVILWQEFNGHWEDTYLGKVGGASAFVSAFRRLALILRSNPNCIICWSPNVYKAGATSSPLDPKAAYPGKDLVDWVTPDGYDKGTYHTFDQIFGQVIKDYGPHGTRAQHPIMIGETAAQRAEKPDAYVDSVHASLTGGLGKGNVKGVLWFDNPWSTDQYNIDATVMELAEYKKLVNDPALRAA